MNHQKWNGNPLHFFFLFSVLCHFGGYPQLGRKSMRSYDIIIMRDERDEQDEKSIDQRYYFRW